MKHVQTLFTGSPRKAHPGCGECQTSCQSACKTSCTVANQSCEQPPLVDSVRPQLVPVYVKRQAQALS